METVRRRGVANQLTSWSHNPIDESEEKSNSANDFPRCLREAGGSSSVPTSTNKLARDTSDRLLFIELALEAHSGESLVARDFYNKLLLYPEPMRGLSQCIERVQLPRLLGVRPAN